MFITVKVSKKDWKNLIKDFKKAEITKMDKIFESQVKCPFYKSPKKIALGRQSNSKNIAKIVDIKTNFLSRYYSITICINEKHIASSVILANIEKKTIRPIFELQYNVAYDTFCIEAFALVDKDNPKAESKLIKILR